MKVLITSVKKRWKSSGQKSENANTKLTFLNFFHV